MTEERLRQILQTLRGELSRILGGQLEAVYLLGSQVRSEAKADSDICCFVHDLLNRFG